MKLKDYLDDIGMTPTAFAREIGASHVAVLRWLNGTRSPNSIMMERIIRATRGHVTPNDFFEGHLEGDYGNGQEGRL